MNSPSLKTIFSEALLRAGGAERAVYLDRACRNDGAHKGQIEALLRDHERIGRFIGTAVRSISSTVETAEDGAGDPQSGEITQADTPGERARVYPAPVSGSPDPLRPAARGVFYSGFKRPSPICSPAHNSLRSRIFSTQRRLT